MAIPKGRNWQVEGGCRWQARGYRGWGDNRRLIHLGMYATRVEAEAAEALHHQARSLERAERMKGRARDQRDRTGAASIALSIYAHGRSRNKGKFIAESASRPDPLGLIVMLSKMSKGKAG